MLEIDNFEPAEVTYVKTFEFILTQMTRCYYKMLEKYPEIENHEEVIRNRLWKDFLNSNEIKAELALKFYFFIAEGMEVGDDYKEKGWTDIKVILYPDALEDTNAYFVIECKRLDGNATLNKKYVENGIQRFSTIQYPSYFGLSGMIGFVIRTIDIDSNCNDINKIMPLYPETACLQPLTKYPFIQSEILTFDSSYLSQHKDKNNNPIDLYHLMWDFSSHIKT